jgi:flagellar capping protein FliD
MTSVNQLNSFFTSIISDIMLMERQPVTALKTQRDTLSMRSSIFTDAKNKLQSLQTAVKTLTSTGSSPALVAGRTTSVADAPEGFNVFSASASSTAVVGDYRLDVHTLAKTHRVKSSRQAYSDQSLGLSGTIIIGGGAARSVDAAPENTHTNESVTAYGTAALAEGQQELGSGAFFVETRNDATYGWQFRLVDADGQAASIRQGSTDTFGNTWQGIPTDGSAYDTGRGLTLTFAQSGYQVYNRDTSGVAKATYLAQGASITIEAGQSLNSIAATINEADFAEGNAVTATVVDRQLVLSARESGTLHKIYASDASGTVLASLGVLGADGGEGDTGAADGFQFTLQEAANATFDVNGVPIVRSKNIGLSDVISGVTINLAADAENRSATLNIAENWTSGLSAVDDFVTKFNSVVNYLQDQTAVSEASSSGTNKTYTRGALADDNIFGELRINMIFTFMGENSNSGLYSSMREIGLTVTDGLQASVSDRTALETALQNNPDDVKALMDRVMGSLDTMLGGFTGVTGQTGYLDSSMSSITNQIKDVDEDISDLNTRLVEREAYLVDQYAGMQATLLTLSYTQQMLASFYGSYS